MNLDTIAELYQLISRGTEDIPSRKNSIMLRKAAINSCLSDPGFTKLAFDTRRIDQETEYNPRRGLQSYHRSEKFISDDLSIKLQALLKLRRGVQELKEIYGHEPAWQDSYSRILLSSLDKGLRINEKDGDFTADQPGMGSISYLEQLLHARYRLNMENIEKMSEVELRATILAKDEDLIHAGLNNALDINKKDVSEKSYSELLDQAFRQANMIKNNAPAPRENASLEKLFAGDNLMEKLFGAENQASPEVERTVTITIKRR